MRQGQPAAPFGSGVEVVRFRAAYFANRFSPCFRMSDDGQGPVNMESHSDTKQRAPEDEPPPAPMVVTKGWAMGIIAADTIAYVATHFAAWGFASLVGGDVQKKRDAYIGIYFAFAVVLYAGIGLVLWKMRVDGNTVTVLTAVVMVLVLLNLALNMYLMARYNDFKTYVPEAEPDSVPNEYVGGVTLPYIFLLVTVVVWVVTQRPHYSTRLTLALGGLLGRHKVNPASVREGVRKAVQNRVPNMYTTVQHELEAVKTDGENLFANAPGTSTHAFLRKLSERLKIICKNYNLESGGIPQLIIYDVSEYLLHPTVPEE